MDAATPDTWLTLLGRLHPLVLHVPIGALVLLVGAELWGRASPARRLEPGMRAFLCVVVAVGTLASAGSGWLLGEEFGTGGDTFWWHRALGLALAACVTLAAAAALLARDRAYATLLALSFALLFPVGHLGAELTHGRGFLTEPFAPPQAAEPVETAQVADEPGGYERVIAPLLAARCGRCHGADKQKGGLALHEPERLLLAGDSGLAAVVPGDPARSELLRRMRLPLEHDDHMPPPNKPQPTVAELAALEAWIAAGASLTAPLEVEVAPAEPSAVEEPEPEPPAPPAAALEALRAEHVHVELLDPERRLHWIDFRARPATDDAFAREHLEPLTEYVLELNLARTAVGDGALELAARMPRLERLDLSGTACTAAGLAALRGHPTLRSLNLTGTRLDDSIGAALATLPALERVQLWSTGVSPGALDLPGVAVELGEVRPAQALEVEPPPELGAPELAPINASCPVSGEPVDPAFRVVHDGRVVGFCCADCAATFWAAPDEHPIDG